MPHLTGDWFKPLSAPFAVLLWTMKRQTEPLKIAMSSGIEA